VALETVLKSPASFSKKIMSSVSFQDITKRMQDMWSLGNFTPIAATTVLVGEQLCESVDLRAGQRVLDVATGSGNTALSAARRSCVVTGIDFVPYLLETARKRAEIEQLKVEFKEGGAENIPFPDESFDVVLSTFGCMFAPDQARTASELVRVCRPGGKIGLAAWTPDSFTVENLKISGKYSMSPPPPNMKPAWVWGSKEGLEDLFTDKLSSINTTRKSVLDREPSAESLFEKFTTLLGPLIATYQRLDQNKRESMKSDFVELVKKFNRSGDSTVVLQNDYLEIVARTKA
jgi:ubiquinone/menaquinone biosynthesis C-methylase UbiE